MKLPVFDGVQEALERYNVQRKRALDEYKTEARKKRRVQLKVQRTKESQRLMEWSKKHGHDTYGHNDDDLECASAKVASKGRKKKTLGKCRACGSSTHQRSNHKDCPFNKGITLSQMEDGFINLVPAHVDCSEHSESGEEIMCTDSDTDESSDIGCPDDDIISGASCTCGAGGRAHKKNCPMNSRKRYPGHALFPPPGNTESSPMPIESDGGLEPADQSALKESLKAPPAKKGKTQMKVGDYVCIHSSSLGECHVPCRVVRDFGNCYQLYCSKGVLTTSFSGSELVVPHSKCHSIPLDRWRQAPRVSIRSIVHDPAILEHCDCNLPKFSESTVILSSSEDEDRGGEMWVRNVLYTLTHDDRKMVVSSYWVAQ